MPMPKTVKVDVSEFEIKNKAGVTSLYGDDLSAYNDIQNPSRIKPTKFELEFKDIETRKEFTYTMPGNSFSVLRLHIK